MEKKFKCQSCGQTFIGDMSKYVVCPNCQSDNVALVKGTGPALKYTLIGMVAIAVIALVVICIRILNNPTDDNQEEDPTEYIMPASSAADHQSISEVPAGEVQEIEKALPVELAWESTSAPIHNPANNTYSITVQARMTGSKSDGIAIEYYLYDLDGKEIKKSATGEFRDIKPIKDATNPECRYIVVAKAVGGDDGIPELQKDIAGFVDVPATVQSVPKLSVADVQKLINEKASATVLAANPSIDSKCPVRCVDDDKNIQQAPKTLNKLIDSIDMADDLTVTVTKLDYADNGKVSCIYYSASIKK